jgi:hypothetical protein
MQTHTNQVERMSSNNSSSTPYVGWFYAALSLSLFFFLLAAAQMCVYVYEDTFINTLDFFLLWKSYATNTSIIVVSGLIFFFLTWREWLSIRKKPELFYAPFRNFWLQALAYFIALLLSIGFVVTLIRTFNGNLHTSTLIRLAIYFVIGMWAITVLWLKRTKLALTMSQAVFITRQASVIGIIGIALLINFIYAPPSLVKQATSEIDLQREIISYTRTQYIKQYIKNHGALPQTLPDLPPGLTYVPQGKYSYQICVVFETSHILRRRLSWRMIVPPKGKYCDRTRNLAKP